MQRLNKNLFLKIKVSKKKLTFFMKTKTMQIVVCMIALEGETELMFSG